jgi:hypothetical protein
MKPHSFLFLSFFLFLPNISVGNCSLASPMVFSDSSFLSNRFVLGFDFALTNQYSSKIKGSNVFYNKTIRFPTVSYKLNKSTLIGIRFSKMLVPKNVKEIIYDIKSVKSLDFSIKHSFLSQYSLRPYLALYNGFGTQNQGYGSFDPYGEYRSKNRIIFMSISPELGLSYFFNKNISLNIGTFYLKQFETLILRPLKDQGLSSLKAKKFHYQTNSIGFNFGTNYYF